MNGTAFRTTSSLILGMVILAAAVDAQEEPAPSMVIIRLEKADSYSLVELLQKVYGNEVVCESHPESNSLLLHAQPATIEEVRRFVKEFDALERLVDDRVVEVLPLEHVAPQTIEKTLKMVLDRYDAEYALDTARGQVIVSAPKAVIEKVRSLLALVDRPPPARAPGRTVRLVWLVRDRSQERELPDPPADLASVLEELAKFDVVDLRLGCQTIVQTLADGDFDLAAKPFIGEDSCSLSVEGHLSEGEDGINSVEVSLSATDEESERQLCELSTTVIAPLGHAVVLCMTPTDLLESVFVFQVLEGPKRRGPSSKGGAKTGAATESRGVPGTPGRKKPHF